MDDGTLGQVSAIVARHLPDAAVWDGDADADLRAAGLDSIRVVALLVDVEGEFGVRFPSEHVTPATFESVRSLHSVVLKCRA